MKTLTIKKAATLAALTLTPALALTSAAQADPYRPAPRPQYSKPAPAWNNNSRYNQNQRFDSHRNDDRFDSRRNDNRFDPRRDNDRNRNKGKSGGNDTAKIIGAGVVGAILGAVLSR